MLHSSWPEPQLGYLSLHQVRSFFIMITRPTLSIYKTLAVINSSLSPQLPQVLQLRQLVLDDLATIVTTGCVLFQSGSQVVLKWSPNSLMDANGQQSGGNPTSWQQALSIDMATVLFLHCHQVGS